MAKWSLRSRKSSRSFSSRHVSGTKIIFRATEIRSDALSVKVFYKKCSVQNSCQILDRSEDLSADLSKKILTKASIYEKENKTKKKKKYINSKLDD